MKHKKLYNINEELHNTIINAAYGDSGLFDTIKIFLLRKILPEVNILFKEYRASAKTVHSIESVLMPDELSEKIKSKTCVLDTSKNSFFFDFYSFVFSRPVVSTAAAGIIVIIIISSAFIKRPDLSNMDAGQAGWYSQEEIALANKQARHALAIIGKVFNQTENTIKNDILAKRVGQPINKGLNVVNELFNKENKNETLN